jgi:hypothetical protein
MNERLNAQDAERALGDHAHDKGLAIHATYGPDLNWESLLDLLNDRECVRYPCTIKFDSTQLQAGEFAYPQPLGDRPEDGFVILVHQHFEDRKKDVPALVLYQLVAVNYGKFAPDSDAERFGAAALGMEVDAYYHYICQLADELQ